MRKLLVALLLVVFGVYLIGVVKAKGCKVIPREVFFGNIDKKIQPTISPDGKYLAYTAPVNKVLNTWIKTIGKNDDRPITHDTNRGVTSPQWTFDGKHILYTQDTGGNENWRLYSVSIEDGSVKEYTPFEGVQVAISHYIKQFPDLMLIEMNKRDPKAKDVYKLNLTTGELTLVMENPGNVIGWIPDNNLNVLGKIEPLPEGGYRLFVRNTVDLPWRELITWPFEDGAPGIIYYSLDNNYLYVVEARNSNTSRFVKIAVKSGELTVLASDSEYDINGSVFIHPETLEPLAISYIKDRAHWIFFDEGVKESFSQLRDLDHGEMVLLSNTLDCNKWIVAYIKDNGPVTYWFFDRKTGEKTFLFENNPIYKKYSLASMEPIHFHARDGLLIRGYLTLPCGDKKTNLPLIVNVHGGPWLRDSWGFDTEVQWLANRGYAVLQVNYRGSTGYGKAFVNASNKQWGRAMQDDLTDAVKWVIDQGIADPARVAIFGGSYGGYAALAGATFTPDLYKCAVDIVGISNIFTFIETMPPYWSLFIDLMKKRVGDPIADYDLLKAASPLFHVENIKIPILIAQGANDPRVKQSESEQIVEAMKKKGLNYIYLLFEDEGHGFVKPENKLKFYKVAEKFLADNLGGIYEA